MAVRPALEKDVGGALTVDTSGDSATTPTSGTIQIYDENGTITSVNGASVTVSGTTLSYTVAAGIVDAVGWWAVPSTDGPESNLRTSGSTQGYRARWTYVISSTTYKRDQLFDVVKTVARTTLGTTLLYSSHYPILATRTFAASGAMTHAQAVTRAWWETCEAIEGMGYNANLIIDPGPLEPVTAAFAAALIARNFAAGGEWQEWGTAQREHGRQLLSRALASVKFYDVDGDLVPGAGEVSAKLNRTMITR